jgi:hypothetical protein
MILISIFHLTALFGVYGVHPNGFPGGQLGYLYSCATGDAGSRALDQDGEVCAPACFINWIALDRLQQCRLLQIAAQCPPELLQASSGR